MSNEQIKFTGCKHLDFETNFHNCKKNLLGSGKVFWLRDVLDPDLPSMVQFCKLRGRLNHPDACTTASHARCREYGEITHKIPLIEID